MQIIRNETKVRVIVGTFFTGHCKTTKIARKKLEFLSNSNKLSWCEPTQFFFVHSSCGALECKIQNPRKSFLWVHKVWQENLFAFWISTIGCAFKWEFVLVICSFISKWNFSSLQRMFSQMNRITFSMWFIFPLERERFYSENFWISTISVEEWIIRKRWRRPINEETFLDF